MTPFEGVFLACHLSCVLKITTSENGDAPLRCALTAVIRGSVKAVTPIMSHASVSGLLKVRTRERFSGDMTMT